MNKRIQQLLCQARKETGAELGMFSSRAEERFAELIIRDCMDVVDGYTKGRTFDTHYDAVEQIEALFGIKHNGDDE